MKAGDRDGFAGRDVSLPLGIVRHEGGSDSDLKEDFGEFLLGSGYEVFKNHHGGLIDGKFSRYLGRFVQQARM